MPIAEHIGIDVIQANQVRRAALAYQIQPV